eukprot:m.670999 g.670999  ORF g.670999 m.670999 type:complete len:373 (+) comp22769_c0_seq11:443-1561(+)
MEPGKRLQCPDCQWWGGHDLNCPEMKKDIPRSGIRDNPLRWDDASPKAMQERLRSEAPTNTDRDMEQDRKSADSAGGPSQEFQSELFALQTPTFARKRLDDTNVHSKIAQDIYTSAPDMTASGQLDIKTPLQKCTTCKIKIPQADCLAYKLSKHCPFGNAACPFLCDAASSSACTDSTSASDIEDAASVKMKRVLKAAQTMQTPTKKSPMSVIGYWDICGDRSVLKKVLKPGLGSETPPLHARVHVHYVGSFPETGEVFDKSNTLGAPFAFELAPGVVIPGWVDAVLTMKKHERASFLLRPAKAYGSRGTLRIPPNSVLCANNAETAMLLRLSFVDRFSLVKTPNPRLHHLCAASQPHLHCGMRHRNTDAGV